MKKIQQYIYWEFLIFKIYLVNLPGFQLKWQLFEKKVPLLIYLLE